MITLKPIRETTEEYDAIEAKIKSLFKREIYLPILLEIAKKSSLVQNSKDTLLRALQSGRITYYRGKFSGSLNATISRELKNLGARWDRKLKCFSIPQADLPYDVRSAASAGENIFLEKVKTIDKKLAAIVPEELASKLKIEHLFDRTIYKVDKELSESVKSLTIAPQLSKEQRDKVAKEWQSNMDIWIKDFTKEQVEKLRVDIQESVYSGNRYESALKRIQKSYSVTENKAKFLARQETALLTTKLKEVRYQDAGIKQYKWKSVAGSKLHPVRPRHKALNDASAEGKIFRFDQPPITSEPGTPERRNNPGADYNCRCVAIPVVQFTSKARR